MICPNFYKRIVFVKLLLLVGFTLPSFSQSAEKLNDVENNAAYNSILSNNKLIDTVPINLILQITNQLKALKFKSGKVYLWGTGFEKPIGIQFSNKMYFDNSIIAKFKSGTKITFEKCVFQNEKEELITLHKTILLK